MPKYFFLYKNDAWTRDAIFQSDYTANTEQDVREYFKRHYKADMVDIRKGKKFSDSEIRNRKNKLRYA